MRKITLLNKQQAQEPFIKNIGWKDTYFIKGVTDTSETILLSADTFVETINANSLRVKFGSEYTISLDEFVQEIKLELISFEELGALLLINDLPYLLRVYNLTNDTNIQQIGVKFPDLRIIDFGSAKNNNVKNLNGLLACSKLQILNLNNCLGLNDLSALPSFKKLNNLWLDGFKDEFQFKYIGECKNLTKLSQNKSDIKILEHLSRLKKLEVFSCNQNNKITDISPLSGLHLLVYLDLSWCTNLTDITPISSLNALTNLYLYCCRNITDIRPLINLNSLENLDLGYCENLTDFGPISSLHALKNLNIRSCTNFTDLSLLSGLKSLKTLNLSWNENLTDINLISGLHSLEYLHLSGCKNIKDISAISSLHTLKNLYLGNCTQFTDFSPISNLHDLEYLDLKNSRLFDLSPILNLYSLTNLNLELCRNINDLSPLSGLKSLKKLNLGWCSKLSDISPISGINTLTDLDLSFTNLTDLSSISGFNSLKSLDLSNCKNITDFSPLSGLYKLKILNLSNCENLFDLSAISGLNTLTNLNITKIKNITKVEALEKLEYLEDLNLSECPNIRDFKKLENLARLRKLEWIDPLACSEVLMSSSYNRLDILFINSNLNQWIQEIFLSKDAVLFSALLLNCISCIDPETRKTHLAAVSTAMRKRGIESESSNDLDTFTWETWCNLVLDLNANEAFASFELAVYELNIPRETEVILGPVIEAASEFIQKYPSEKEKTVQWVNEQLNQLESYPQETRQIAPSAAVFFASLNKKEEVLYWLQKATDEKAPLWRERVILALINYYARKNDFTEARRLLDEMQIQEEKDKAIASLAQVMAANFPIEAGFLLDDIEQTTISSDTALNLLQEPAMLREPQGIYQLLIHLQSTPDQLASTIEKLIDQDTEGKVAASLKQLFLTPQHSGPSAAVFLELCKHPTIGQFVKAWKLEELMNELQVTCINEQKEQLSQFIDLLEQKKLIDSEEKPILIEKMKI